VRPSRPIPRRGLTSGEKTQRGKKPSLTDSKMSNSPMSSTGSGAVSPVRGEIWEVDLNPTLGRVQAGRRPALVVSANALNSGPRGLVVVIPVTGTARGLPTHIPVIPPEGGLTKPSVIMVEQIRAVSKDRLGRRYGVVTQATMGQVDRMLQIVLGL
jgi:mRNA interferase MazF